MGEHLTNPRAAMAATRPACVTCVHFYPENEKGGHCRRYPPTAMMVPQMTALGQPSVGLRSSWPPTTPDRWCGEHPGFMRWLLQTGGGEIDASSPN